MTSKERGQGWKTIGSRLTTYESLDSGNHQKYSTAQARDVLRGLLLRENVRMLPRMQRYILFPRFPEGFGAFIEPSYHMGNKMLSNNEDTPCRNRKFAESQRDACGLTAALTSRAIICPQMARPHGVGINDNTSQQAATNITRWKHSHSNEYSMG